MHAKFNILALCLILLAFTATASAACPGVCEINSDCSSPNGYCVNCDCIPKASPASVNIVSFDIEPDAIFVDDLSVNIEVVVRQIADPVPACDVVVSFFDSDNALLLDPLPILTPIGAFSDGLSTVTIPPNFSNLEVGIYSAKADVQCDNSGNEFHASKSKNFSISEIRQHPIPETNWLGILLVLFSALLIFKFARRRP